MAREKILDKNITTSNYATFHRCTITNSGKAIKFIMAGGAIYQVPISYFLAWFDKPHYIHLKGKWIKWDSSKHKIRGGKEVTFKACRRILSKHAVRVCLSNSTCYVVPWDTVLMACEREYEHFGGLTNESRRMTHKFHKTGNRCT